MIRHTQALLGVYFGFYFCIPFDTVDTIRWFLDFVLFPISLFFKTHPSYTADGHGLGIRHFDFSA